MALASRTTMLLTTRECFHIVWKEMKIRSDFFLFCGG
jgi:hypothetical protein